MCRQTRQRLLLRDGGSAFLPGENNCLGNAGSFSGPGAPDDPITLDQVPDTLLRESLSRICRLAHMEVGSVEYLIPRGESTACFFDINPVSTYHPGAADFLGYNPYSKLAAWLKDRCR